MSQVSVSEFRENMAKHLDQLVADRDELVLTRQNHEAVVVVPLREWNGMKETVHLMSSRVNAERLMRSIAAFQSTDQDVVEPVQR
jgi:antitoxin YefM